MDEGRRFVSYELLIPDLAQTSMRSLYAEDILITSDRNTQENVCPINLKIIYSVFNLIDKQFSMTFLFVRSLFALFNMIYIL